MNIVDRLPEDLPPDGVRDVLRKVTDEDQIVAEENDTLTYSAHKFCESRIRERQLDMKLVDVEVLFDRSKLVFFFTAPTRIDFRELVKDLVREYHTASNCARSASGMRRRCSARWGCGMCVLPPVPAQVRASDHQNGEGTEPVSEPVQDFGHLRAPLCCLSYEQENYDIFHSSCPRLGKRYQTNKGPMKVLRANMFRNSVALLTDTNEELELTLDEWQALDPRRPDAPPRPEGKPDAKPENKPSSPRPHDELMVVMADPDTIDEAFGDESDELVDDLGGLNDGEMETLEEGLRPKRKRKRKR
ncbi:MAG: regulatory iron-sulfur-containing complex subunit RicT [Bilophila wadsworthia]